MCHTFSKWVGFRFSTFRNIHENSFLSQYYCFLVQDTYVMFIHILALFICQNSCVLYGYFYDLYRLDIASYSTEFMLISPNVSFTNINIWCKMVKLTVSGTNWFIHFHILKYSLWYRDLPMVFSEDINFIGSRSGVRVMTCKIGALKKSMPKTTTHYPNLIKKNESQRGLELLQVKVWIFLRLQIFIICWCNLFYL